MKPNFVEKIKSRGYYRVNFQPTTYERRFERLGDCEKLIEQNRVRLRGWDYPHFPSRNDQGTGIDRLEGYVQGWIDWSLYVEFWRMYQSGQFLHYAAFREDWYEQNASLRGRLEPMKSLGIVGSIIFQITEVAEFLRRLAVTGLYREGAVVSISFCGLQGRALSVDDPRRHSFFNPKISSAQSFVFEERFTHDELRLKSRDIAVDSILRLVDLFGWDDAHEDLIREQQDQFLSGRS